MRILPEAVSLLTGLAAWYGVENWLPGGYEAGMRGMLLLSLLAALLSACVYRLAKRPAMWVHMLMQALSYVLFAILTYTPPRYDRPPNDLGPFLYLLALLVIAIYLLPALPVCVVYRGMFAERFGKGRKTSDQGSENI